MEQKNVRDGDYDWLDYGCFKIASNRRGFSHSSLLLKDKEFYINKFLEKERLVTHGSVDVRAQAGPYVTYIDYTFYATLIASFSHFS